MTLDPLHYPRVYTLKPVARIFSGAVGLGYILAALFFFKAPLSTAAKNGITAEGEFLAISLMTWADFMMYALGLMLLILGYLLIAQQFLKVTLLSDAIEIRNYRGTKRLRRDAIKGVRYEHDLGVIRFIPKFANSKPLTMPSYIRMDTMFESWVKSLRNLDKEFNKSDYPRSYKPPLGIFMTGIIFSGLGLTMIRLGLEVDGPRLQFGLYGGLLVSSFGIWLLATYFLLRVTLSVEAIEVRNIFSARQLHRDEIKRTKLIRIPAANGNRFEFIIFIPYSSENKSITLPMLIEKDDAFKSWVLTLG